MCSEPPPHKLSHILSHPTHAPELTTEELSAPPSLATSHLMRIAPCTKAVAWCVSRRFLARLLRAQQARPHFGPVDVWAWRVRHEEDGGAVRAYAPLTPWGEESEDCMSHHAPEQSDAAGQVQVEPSHERRAPCPDELPEVARRWCQEMHAV